MQRKLAVLTSILEDMRVTKEFFQDPEDVKKFDHHIETLEDIVEDYQKGRCCGCPLITALEAKQPTRSPYMIN